LSTNRIVEAEKGRKRLDSGGLSSLWDYKIQTADDLITGGKDWLGMGAEVASIYRNKYPKMIDMLVMPDIPELTEMIRTLKGRSAEAAIAAEDLEEENWDIWRQNFGNWLPHPSMLGMTSADFGY